MKKRIRNGLCALLSTVLLLTLLPGATLAAPNDLRNVIVNHTKAIANIEYQLEHRIARLEYSDAQKELIFSNGALPTVYFDYARLRSGVRGVLVTPTSGSFEAFKSRINSAGMLLGQVDSASGAGNIYGMNANSFLLDVVSRVSPVRFTTAKQAMNSEALVSLLDNVNLNAASSKAAIGNTSFDNISAAYANLSLGDILIAYDDNADQDVDPKLHVMIVTDMDPMNRGQVTVTYPSYDQPIYHFVCSKCGKHDTEGPTTGTVPNHVTSVNYEFSAFKTHAQTDPSSGCNGVWESAGATTWMTQTVSFAQLFGQNGESVPAGGQCYLPYTLAAYTQSETTPVDVKLTTDTTADNISAGFTAQITSNYRIVQVDAVLSQPGKPDRVFTNYPAWDAWSYQFQNDELDRTLFESDSGNYSLTINVHSGPVDNSNTLAVPVTNAYHLNLSLDAPSFQLKSSADTVSQGELFSINVHTMINGITGASLTMSYDTDLFAIDTAATRTANANINVMNHPNGTVTVTYFGAALSNNDSSIKIFFRPVRTGSVSIPVARIQPFNIVAAQVSTKNGATSNDLAPARVGGDLCRVGIGCNTVIYKNYAGNYDLLLVFIEGGDATVTYDGVKMPDVTHAYYLVDGKRYTDTYAIVTPRVDVSKLSATLLASASGSTVDALLKYNLDVDRNGIENIADAQAICNIISGKLPLENNLESYLLADVNRDGKVDSNDVTALMAELRS